MKYLLLLVLSFVALSAQTQNTCCSWALSCATSAMASMAADPAFREAHADPTAFVYKGPLGEMIQIPAKGDKDAQAYEIKAKVKTNQYLLVVHEWWGLNDYIKQEADALYYSLDGQVNVIALDLYDGKVATAKDSAALYAQSVKQDRAIGIINAVFAHAGPKAQYAVIGWCFGGGWALQASLLAGKSNLGTVMYYGSPETDVKKLKQFNGELLGIFAEQDQWISPAVVKQFEENLTAAGVKHTIKRYNAVHAFANPSNPNYNKDYTLEAYQTSVSFLVKVFKL